MKLKFAIPFFALFTINVSLAGQDLNSIFEQQTPITWLGLDFTAAQFVGDEERLNDDEVIYKLMESLNALMLAEPEKFDIRRTFNKIHVENALEITQKQNNLLKAETLRSTSLKESPQLTFNIIQEIISHYDFQNKEGIGLMFNIESFNKNKLQGSLWVTFIDMKTHHVLLTKRMMKQPIGFGLRNYWAGCIYSILKQIRGSEFNAWKKKHYQSVPRN